MRRFELHRDDDPSGVSGTGVVAEGVELTDGIAVLRWLGDYPSTVVHDGGLKAVEYIHGHAGATRVVMLDDGDDDDIVRLVGKELLERCAEVMHDIRSSTPWKHTSDWDKTTERLAAGAVINYLDDNSKGRTI